MPFQIDSDFPGANGTYLGRDSTGCALIEIRPDPGIGTSHWFCFAVERTRRCAIAMRIVNAGQTTYARGWLGFRVASSSAGENWARVDSQFETDCLLFRHEAPAGRTVYAAFSPYPAERVDDLIAALCNVSGSETSPVATSLDGATIKCLSLGSTAPEAIQHWIIAGQHGGEPPANWFAEGLIEALAGEKDARLGRLLARARLHIVPALNIDGMRRGYLRTNAAGVDLNRQWANTEWCMCPEVAGLLQAMAARGANSFLDVHTDFELPYVYFDVVETYLGAGERHMRQRACFEQALQAHSADFLAGRRYDWTEPPERPFLLSMAAPAVGKRFGIAAMTLELPICRYLDRSGGQSEWSPERSKALGRAAALAYADITDEIARVPCRKMARFRSLT